MTLLIANGQLPTSLTTPLATATYSDLWTLRLRNTSSSVAQTITYEVLRMNPTTKVLGTARTMPGCCTLPAKGSALIGPIPMEAGDTHIVSTTTATNTDYDLTGAGVSPGATPYPQDYRVQVWDQNGSLQTTTSAVYPAVYSVAAGGTAIGNATALTAGAPSQISYVSGANNAAAVQLPVAVAGQTVTIISTTSGSTLQVFPQVLSKINAAANNAVYNVPNLGVRTFYAVTATQWYTNLETIN